MTRIKLTYEYAHHPQPKMRQCPQCLKICVNVKNKEGEHLDDDGGDMDELPDLMLQNTQVNIKAHKKKQTENKAHKTHENKRNRNMIQKGLEADYS